MPYHCGRCGAANPEDSTACEECGAAMETATNTRLTAVVLNELANLHREGELETPTYQRLHQRYHRRLLDYLRPAPPPAPTTAAAPSIPVGPAPSPVPSWLVEQAPNLLLYLAAFLVVMAALVFATTSRETLSGPAQVALLASITAAFMGVGWLCYRFPRVRIAGYTFLAVGALLVPLNFAGAYNFVLREEGIPGDVVWLWASLYSAVFYILLAVLGLGLLYGFMSHAAVVSAVAAAIAVTDLPPEWTPPVFVGLALIFLPLAWCGPGRLRDAFRLPSLVFGHFLAAASVSASFIIVGGEPDVDTATLSVTLAAATCLFTVMATANALDEGRLYASLSLCTLTGALAAGLVVSPMPPQWMPPVFGGLALALLPVAWWAPARLREQFALPSFVAAHLLATGAAVAAAVITVEVAETDFERSALPVALAVASAVFVLLALREKVQPNAMYYCGAALTTLGGMLLAIVFTLGKDAEFYSVALAGIGALYAAGALLPVRHRLLDPDLLWPFAIGAASLAWLPFLDAHDREPWFGVGATWGAAALYATAAVFVDRAPWLRHAWRILANLEEAPEEAAVDRWTGPLLLLPFAAAVGLGYYRLLLAMEVDLGGAELALRYLPLAFAFAAAGVAARFWRREWSPALYAIAIGYSVFVLATAYENAGLTAVLLAAFAVSSAAVVIAESKADAVYLPLAYALFAVIFALVHFEPRDEVWPLPFVGMAVVLYASSFSLEQLASSWARALRLSGLAVALFAPNIGYGLLAFRASEAADIGRTFVISEPPLYLWSMGAVAVFGLLLAAEAWRTRAMAVGYASSVTLLTALLLGIGHFRPENPQAYTVPIGLYLLGTARFLSPHRESLPEDLAFLPNMAEIAAAGVLLGTTFLQAFNDDTTYRFILLGESIVYLLAGLLLRRRLMVVPALAFAAIAAALFAFERQAEGGVPPWAILAIVGVSLIGVGFLFLVRRDLWERAQRAVFGWWQAWEEG
ncbi:MAG: zinc ribbon domain-containing protein [Dehalococcoidia bacterium]|nr:zinc ribbon domain-containing protein [Dehalococcoidia bacterium]